jgi:hypothetical protein
MGLGLSAPPADGARSGGLTAAGCAQLAPLRRQRRLQQLLQLPVGRRRHGDGPQAFGLGQELQHQRFELLEVAGPEHVGSPNTTWGTPAAITSKKRWLRSWFSGTLSTSACCASSAAACSGLLVVACRSGTRPEWRVLSGRYWASQLHQAPPPEQVARASFHPKRSAARSCARLEPRNLTASTPEPSRAPRLQTGPALLGG